MLSVMYGAAGNGANDIRHCGLRAVSRSLSAAELGITLQLPTQFELSKGT